MAIEFCKAEVNPYHSFDDKFDDDVPANGRSQCILSVKLARKWHVVMWNEVLVIALLALLSLTVFAIETEDYTERLARSLTLLFTTVLYDTRTPTKSYRTLMDTYQLYMYAFMVAVMVCNIVE